jgi:hypothetical protein
VFTADEAATVVSFHILANSLFTDHFFVPHCFVRTIEDSLSNSVLLLLLLLPPPPPPPPMMIIC